MMTDRRSFIGSDARIIMGNDEARLIRLWREKRGEAEPEDLSQDLIVQLGSSTEDLNRAWYERNTGHAVEDVQRREHIGIYFERLLRFASRTPAPPPFSGMNSTPAFSSARTRAWIVRSCAPSSPGWVSSRLILGRDTPDASAKSFCSHRSSILAARTCSLVSGKI
jgi:hypothetical protein